MTLVDLSWQKQAACAGQTHLFFPERCSGPDVRRARRICRTCPVFDQCVAWGLENYDEIPEGIFFGYTAVEREQMKWGSMRYRDWRGDFTSVSKRSLAALERSARAAGVPAVVNAYNLYEVEDPQEREAIVQAYHRWQADQQFPSTYYEAKRRAEHLSKIKSQQPGHTRPRLPPGFRPPCPNGHGPENMRRLHRKTGDVWGCYLCNGKVRVSDEDLLAKIS